MTLGALFSPRDSACFLCFKKWSHPVCGLGGRGGRPGGWLPCGSGWFAAWSTPLPAWTTIPVSFPLWTDIWVVSGVASSGEAAVGVGAHGSGGHAHQQGLPVAGHVCLQPQWASPSASHSGCVSDTPQGARAPAATSSPDGGSPSQLWPLGGRVAAAQVVPARPGTSQCLWPPCPLCGPLSSPLPTFYIYIF